MPSSTVDPEQLNKLAFPDRYINSAGVAHRLVEQAVSSHQKYWKIIRECEEHINGKKPKDPAKLRKAGLAWSSNYNFGKARAKIEQGATESVGEITRSMAMAGVEFRRPKESDGEDSVMLFLHDKIHRDFVGAHVANTFVEMLMGDPRWSMHGTKIEYHSYAYGYCSVVAEGNNDYLGNALHPLAIAFEDRSRIDDIKAWVIFDVIKADKLWRVWNRIRKQKAEMEKEGPNDEKQTFKSNWILEGLQDLIWRNYQGTVSDQQGKTRQVENWEEVLSEFVSDPQKAVSNTKNVRIAKIWNRELDGTFTETYVQYSAAAGEGVSAATPGAGAKSVTASKRESPAVTDHLLYQKNWGKMRSSRKVSIIRDSGIAPNGYIHELRGIARFAVEDSTRFNRQKNSLQDKLLFAGSPMISQPNTKSGAKFEIGVHQGFSLLPAGFSFPANQPRADLQQHVLALQLDEQHYQRETLQFDSKVLGKLSSRPTSDEVKSVVSDAARSQDAKHSIKLTDYSTMFLTMMHRVVEMQPKDNTPAKDAQEFFFSELRWALRDILQTETETEQDKEIKEIVQSIRKVTIDRVVRDVEAIRLSLQTAESPFEVRRLERMLLLALGHPIREVNKLKPPIFESATAFQDQRTAAMENDMFWRTREIVYQTTDDPIVHLDMHWSKLNRVFERVRSGTLDPMQAYNFGVNCLQHSERHLAKIEANPFFRRFFKRYSDNFKFFLNQLDEISRIAEEMAKRAQEAQANGGQAPQIDPEKLAKIQILEMEAVKKQERTDFLTKVKMDQEAEKFERQQQREDLKLQAKLERDQVSSELKQRLKVLETARDALTQT